MTLAAEVGPIAARAPLPRLAAAGWAPCITSGTAPSSDAVPMHQTHQQPFTTTSTSLVADTPVDLEVWLAAGIELLAAASAVNWWVGDWLLEAHRLAGGTSDGDARARREVCARTSQDPQSLERLRHVAEQVPPELRREGLSWAHHAACASWHPEDVVAALDAAEEGVDEPHGHRRLSVSETAKLARDLAAARKVAA